MDKTDIKDVRYHDLVEPTIVLHSITLEEAHERLYDFSYALEERIQAFDVYIIANPMNLYEILSKLLSMFSFTTASIVNKYILAICHSPSVDLMSCFETIDQLTLAPRNTHLAFDALEELCRERPIQLPLVIYTDKLRTLILHDRTKYGELFIDQICCDERISSAQRYALTTQTKTSIDIDYFKFASLHLIEIDSMELRYRVMTCANLLATPSLDLTSSEKTHVCTLLFKWMFDDSLDDNLRADAADLLLQYNPEMRDDALRVLMDLGTAGLGCLSTIYDNKQNVHADGINVNIGITMNYLAQQKCETTLTFEEIRERLNSLVSTSDQSLFEFSLYRIEHQVGSTIMNYTLMEIFMQLYGFIEHHTYRVEMEQRLTEELVEMSDTCTSGYYTRLLNVLTGYADVQLQISWEEQIQANLVGRLNACIRNHEQIDVVLEELTVESFTERPELLKIFLKHISTIREEMASEFAEYIDANDFDLYFRKALIFFDGIQMD